VNGNEFDVKRKHSILKGSLAQRRERRESRCKTLGGAQRACQFSEVAGSIPAGASSILKSLPSPPRFGEGMTGNAKAVLGNELDALQQGI
jgi:hypothetical protein